MKEVAQQCPDGDGPCVKNVGQKVRFWWRFAGRVDPKPDVVAYRIGGTTIENWDGGIDWWNEQTLPVQMLADVEGVFRFRPIRVQDRPAVPGGRPDAGAPALDYEKERSCADEPRECGLGQVCTDGGNPDDECRKEFGSSNHFASWLWKDPGTFTFTVRALRRAEDGALTPMCEASRTFAVERATDDPDRQPVDYYNAGGRTPGAAAAKLHLAWHELRDPAPVFMGEDWVVFHRYLVRSFAQWRSFFGYPPIPIYDGSTAVPAADGGYSMVEPTRPGTFDGTFTPDCYGNGSGCAPPPWFTDTGNGTPRPDDLNGQRCLYATDLNGDFQPDEVRPGQTKLADFQDLRGLGCVVNKTHHALVHNAIPGAFQLLATTPRDPLFWLYHRWASGIGSIDGFPTLAHARATGTADDSVLDRWERAKRAGPPGITAVFPARGLGVARLPGVMVFFWEPVTGVAAGDLSVNGSPATTVVGSGAGPYVFSGFAPPGLGAVDVRLGGGAMRDGDGQPFADDAWANTIAPDRDADDIPDGDDNCPDVPNSDQANTDRSQNATFLYHHVDDGLGDPLGDACDDDDDGDRVSDATELADGTDPLNWRDPDRCPLDPDKTEPGDCGCGVRERPNGGDVECILAPVATCAAPVATAHEHGTRGVTPPACDDDEPCTDDICVEGVGCMNTPATGLAAASCVCRRTLPAACTTRPVPRAVVSAAERACRLVSKVDAVSKPKKRKQLLKRAASGWRTAVQKAGARKVVKKVGAVCAQALTARYLDARTRATEAARTGS